MAAAAALFAASLAWLLRCKQRRHEGEQDQSEDQSEDLPANCLIFTGTGCSSALPMLKCRTSALRAAAAATEMRQEFRCAACEPALAGGWSNPNWRGNVGALIRLRDEAGAVQHVQIDVGKTFRDSVLRWYAKYDVNSLDGILLTHDHADATFGMDDVRGLQSFNRSTKEMSGSIPCYCDSRTMNTMQRVFSYLFPQAPALADSAAPVIPKIKRMVASIDWQTFPEDCSEFRVAGLTVRALPIMHGADYLSFGFGFGATGSRVVYLSDYTALTQPTEKLIDEWTLESDGIMLMVLDALRECGSCPVHASMDQSLDLVQKYRPKRTLLVGMSHGLEHFETNKQLGKLKEAEGLDVQLAHDGQFVSLEF